jgi:hypothetical protein
MLYHRRTVKAVRFHFPILSDVHTMLFFTLCFCCCFMNTVGFVPSAMPSVPTRLVVTSASIGRTQPTNVLQALRRYYNLSNDRRCTTRNQQQRLIPRLGMVNFGPYGDFLNSKVNDNDDESSSSDSMNMNNMDYYFMTSSSQSLDKIDSDAAAGTFRLLDVTTNSMKPGGLRLLIVMYLLGLVNEPQKRTWKVDRPSSDEYVIDFWFHDQSAILSVELIPPSSQSNQDENAFARSQSSVITIDRIGSAPSNQYIIQEAVVLQGLLHELLHCATDPSVPEKDRLLLFPAEKIQTINEVCQILPFG